MQNYEDKYGRYHHKPCINGEPSSNNGWIYSAYADKLGLPLNDSELQSCFNKCLNEHNTFILRSPLKGLPPMSRDEILGAAALGLLKARNLKGWSFSPRPIPRFNPFKLAVQLWELKPALEKVNTWQNISDTDEEDYIWETKVIWKHRNYFWENKLDQLYRFAFSVPIQDRDFILDNTDKKVNIFAVLFYSAVASIDKLFNKPSGITWLKYGKGLAEMKSEFPADHPINER